jgi:hypothetical protein
MPAAMFDHMLQEFIGDTGKCGVDEVIDLRGLVTEPVLCIGDEVNDVESLRLHQSDQVFRVQVAAAEKGTEKRNGVHRGKVKKYSTGFITDTASLAVKVEPLNNLDRTGRGSRFMVLYVFTP